MFKLVVLSALLAVVAAKPGNLYGAHLGYSAVAAPIAYAAPLATIPTAVSHSSRTDVVSKPVVATTYTAAAVAAPVVHTAYAHAAYAAPIAHAAYAAPIAHHAIAGPAVVSHTAYAAAPAHLGYANVGHLGYAGYAGHLGNVGHLGYANGYGLGW